MASSDIQAINRVVMSPAVILGTVLIDAIVLGTLLDSWTRDLESLPICPVASYFTQKAVKCRFLKTSM